MKSLWKAVAAVGLVFVLAGCAIGNPTVTKITDKYWVVSYPLVYSTNDGAQKIVVPEGFLTDLASIPKKLWWWEGPHERTMAPAIVHDYLYWVQTCSKDEADAVMYLAMGETAVGRINRELVYLGIHKTSDAKEAWEKNEAARAKGESRFLSPKYVERLKSAPYRPDLSLEMIYKEAGPGGILPSPDDPAVKRACTAALQYYKKSADL